MIHFSVHENFSRDGNIWTTRAAESLDRYHGGEVHFSPQLNCFLKVVSVHRVKYSMREQYRKLLSLRQMKQLEEYGEIDLIELRREKQ